MRARLAEEAAIAALAVQFLTRLPIPAGIHCTPARLAATPRWYPAVGILVGLVAALVYWVGSLALPPMLAALLSTAAGLALTGALHEDGLADACDGLGGGAAASDALAIMRDSRLGTYGAVALFLVLSAKILAIAALDPALAAPVLVAGHASSRASAVVALATGTYLRREGTGRPVSGGIRAGGLSLALATAGATWLACGLVAGPAAMVGGALGLALGHGVMRRLYGRKLGGYTGDCLGAVQQASEVGLYTGVLACL
jgi:adenosylcobinamide-GDP ribazoletransferase